MTAINGLMMRPRGARVLYVMAHGAGAGMRHAFLDEIARRLAREKIATFRYEFPYMAAGRRRPDTPRILQDTVRLAVGAARNQAPDLPLIVGGKSLGGRMTSVAAASGLLSGVEGLAFLGFPLHAPGRVGDKRAEHLGQVTVPMLFVQGTRDSLADLDRMQGVCKRLGDRTTLHVVDGGDHSFKVLKRFDRDQSEVFAEIVRAVAEWIKTIL